MNSLEGLKLEDNYDALENVTQINDAILNTPAKEQPRVEQQLPDTSVERYLEANKPKKLDPKGGVVLDLGGKQVQIESENIGTEHQSQVLSSIYGEDTNVVDDANKSGGIILFLLIIVGLAVFITMSLKRSDYILRLEDEINKLKENKLW